MKGLTRGKQVILDDKYLAYGIILIATGAHIRPDQSPGLLDGLWHKKIFDFYSMKKALALREYLKTWQGGDFVVPIADVPYKRPVAPLEYVFLADEYFTKMGIRNMVNIKYVAPFSGVFTKPRATRMLSDLLMEKKY